MRAGDASARDTVETATPACFAMSRMVTVSLATSDLTFMHASTTLLPPTPGSAVIAHLPFAALHIPDWKLATHGKQCNRPGNTVYISGNGTDAVHHPKDPHHVDDRRNRPRARPGVAEEAARHGRHRLWPGRLREQPCLRHGDVVPPLLPHRRGRRDRRSGRHDVPRRTALGRVRR